MVTSHSGTHLDLDGGSDLPRFAYAIVKHSWKKTTRGMERVSAPPLRLDPTDALGPGMDGWDKPATDVVFVGAARATSGPVREMVVRCRVGSFERRVAVFGRRVVEWSNGSPRIGAPALFEEMPLVNRNAYGGVDGRVPFARPASFEDVIRLVGAFPGMYPRNPAGKGYVVLPDPVDGIELPNLEDPDDLLSAARIVVGDPARWWQQPLPCTVGFRDLAMFPRLLAGGTEPAFPAPEDDSLEEVRRGILPSGYRTRSDQLGLVFQVQEAPPGQWFADLPVGTPLEAGGMHPEKPTVSLPVPPLPRFTFEIDGRVDEVVPRMMQIVVDPADERIDVTYRGQTIDLPRAFIPRFHKYIPLSVRIDDGARVEYEAPPTLHDALVAGGLRQRSTP